MSQSAVFMYFEYLTLDRIGTVSICCGIVIWVVELAYLEGFQLERTFQVICDCIPVLKL